MIASGARCSAVKPAEDTFSTERAGGGAVGWERGLERSYTGGDVQYPWNLLKITAAVTPPLSCASLRFLALSVYLFLSVVSGAAFLCSPR